MIWKLIWDIFVQICNDVESSIMSFKLIKY